MAGMLIDRTRAQAVERVKATARRIARSSPRLADLPEADLARLAKIVMAEGLKNDLRRAADLERIDYQAERQRFLDRASRTDSVHTRRAYQIGEGGRALLGIGPASRCRSVRVLDLA
jgi:hypothetical protein